MRGSMRAMAGGAALVVVAGMLGGSASRSVSFHLMQIEQIIGGVAGDTGAQVVQLRMRAAGQNFVAQSRLVAYDAAGANPIVLLDIGSNVSNGSGGDRVLIVSPGFDPSWTNPPLVADFVMAAAIPESYLSAGKITFENNTGSRVLWSVAFGGDDYTGTNSGTLDNDADGNFSPQWTTPLPTAALESLRFTGAFNAMSTNNAADYEIAGPAVLANNARTSFTLVGPPDDCEADFNGDGIVDTRDVLAFLNAWNQGDPKADCDKNGNVDTRDVLCYLNLWNAGC